MKAQVIEPFQAISPWESPRPRSNQKRNGSKNPNFNHYQLCPVTSSSDSAHTFEGNRFQKEFQRNQSVRKRPIRKGAPYSNEPSRRENNRPKKRLICCTYKHIVELLIKHKVSHVEKARGPVLVRVCFRTVDQLSNASMILDRLFVKGFVEEVGLPKVWDPNNRTIMLFFRPVHERNAEEIQAMFTKESCIYSAVLLKGPKKPRDPQAHSKELEQTEMKASASKTHCTEYRVPNPQEENTSQSIELPYDPNVQPVCEEENPSKKATEEQVEWKSFQDILSKQILLFGIIWSYIVFSIFSSFVPFYILIGAAVLLNFIQVVLTAVYYQQLWPSKLQVGGLIKKIQ